MGCWSRCERHFHVYRRKDEKSEFKPYADAVFYDEPRYDYGSDYGFDSQTASLNARSMNLTDAKRARRKPIRVLHRVLHVNPVRNLLRHDSYIRAPYIGR